MIQAQDYSYMAQALRLAGRGLYTTDPNPRVGCVLVKDGQVVGEGFHARCGGAHAEIHALEAAGAKAKGATAYVTLEPCSHHGRTPPCTDALISAGVSRVVVAAEDPNPLVQGQGVARLRAAGIDVQSGVLGEQGRGGNPGFFSRMVRGRPWVRVKSAVSLDGRTALANGESCWITGEEARRDVQFLRARSSAIMTGIATVISDDPSLNVRLSGAELGIGGAVRQPLRVVLDTQLRISPEAKILHLAGPCLIVTATEDSRRIDELCAVGAQVAVIGRGESGVDLARVLALLAQREINELHVEAGPVLVGALLEAGMVDELVVYMAPHLLGDTARGLARLHRLDRMEDRLQLRVLDVRTVGKDLKITLVPDRSANFSATGRTDT